MRSLKDIKKIIIHCSDSDFGDEQLIDQWHKQRGFLGIGYHYVILNGMPTHGKPYSEEFDGVIKIGRQLREIGAHCKGHNKDSIGICLIGQRCFTAKQLYVALPDLITALINELPVKIDNIYGHRFFDKGKTCPNFDVKYLKAFLMCRKPGFENDIKYEVQG